MRVSDHGRKFAVIVFALGLFVLVDIGVVVKSFWLKDLDVETMLQVAIGAAALAGAYAGANAWAKQAEAKVEVAKFESELPDEG